MRKIVPAAALACALALPAPALASSTQESLIQDEHRMLELGPAAQAAALDDAKALGADLIRANVMWAHYAPAPSARRKPKGFDGKNPAAYPAGTFDALDGLVSGAQQRGLQVLLTPTGPGPAWASRCGGSVRSRRTCNPKPKLFGAFVRALGARYPQVTRWSIWNEPNQPGWLTPQYRGRVPVAADLYRALARSGLAALRATGHRSGPQQILLGETSPIGRTSGSPARRPITPVVFIKELLCLTRAARGCHGFRRFTVSGWAHHPYTRGGFFPPGSKPNAGEITVSTASRLKRLLDQAGRRGRLPRRLPIFYTENGWQTNPPDMFGVTPGQQADYIDQSDWIAFRDARIRMVAQYKLVDDRESSSFQSGLRYFDGSAKPSYDAYRLPLWVIKRGSGVLVWGQVRPAPDGAAEQLTIQRADRAGTPFSTVATITTAGQKGYFTTKVAASGGVWRLVWSGIDSRQAEVAPR